MKKYSCFLSFSFFLMGFSGCSSLSSHFDCPQTAEIRCQSLDQINQSIDARQARSQLS